jgi:hypothetical protein
MLNRKPFFNPDILSKTDYFVKDGKFIVGDSVHYDWLMTFFIDILKTKKGGKTEVLEPPELDFEVITWEDRKVEKEKSWEGKTYKTQNEKGEIIDEPLSEFNKLLIPLWEDKIEFIIHFPDRLFDIQEYTAFKLSVTTTFSDLIKFVEEFDEEMRAFYRKYADKVKYLGSGKYEELENLYLNEE